MFGARQFICFFYQMSAGTNILSDLRSEELLSAIMFQDYFCHFVTQILSGTGIIYVYTSVGGLFL